MGEMYHLEGTNNYTLDNLISVPRTFQVIAFPEVQFIRSSYMVLFIDYYGLHGWKTNKAKMDRTSSQWGCEFQAEFAG